MVAVILQILKVFLKSGQITLLIRWRAVLLGLPKGFCEGFDHLVFGAVRVFVMLQQLLVERTNTGWTISADLFPDGKMQAHV